MRKGFLIYEAMRNYLVICEEVVSHIRLCNGSLLDFLIYEEYLFSFLSVYFRSSINPIPTGMVYLPYADFLMYAGSDCDYVDAGSGSESGLDGFRPLPPPHPLVVGFILPLSTCRRVPTPSPLPLRVVKQVEII